MTLHFHSLSLARQQTHFLTDHFLLPVAHDIAFSFVESREAEYALFDGPYLQHLRIGTSPLQRSDAELVEAACRGDLASFGQLYDRHYRLAVGIARCRLADVHLAEDAAQEAFAIAYSSLETLKNDERFPQWLGTICRRTASRLAAGRPKQETLPDNREPCTDPSQAALQAQVQEAITQLDDISKEVVVLHYFSRLSHREIAGAIDLSTPAIHGRLQRARRKLAHILAPTGTME